MLLQDVGIALEFGALICGLIYVADYIVNWKDKY